MRRGENVTTADTQQAMNGTEMELHVFGMEMLDQILTKGDVDELVGHVEVVPVVDEELEIRRARDRGPSLIGDIDGDNALDVPADLKREPAVASTELEKRRPRPDPLAKQAELSIERRPRQRRVFAAYQARVVWDRRKQLVVHAGVDRGPTFTGRALELVGERLLHLEVNAQPLD
jgi:hypothetical protein